MTSNKCKQLTAIAVLSVSLVMMGGTAFAAPTGGDTAGLLPGPIGEAAEQGRSTAADVLNQVDRLF